MGAAAGKPAPVLGFGRFLSASDFKGNRTRVMEVVVGGERLISQRGAEASCLEHVKETYSQTSPRDQTSSSLFTAWPTDLREANRLWAPPVRGLVFQW
jgi:hypothetical protein